MADDLVAPTSLRFPSCSSRVDAVSDGSPPRDTIPCGFPSLDKMLGGGFRRGDLDRARRRRRAAESRRSRWRSRSARRSADARRVSHRRRWSSSACSSASSRSRRARRIDDLRQGTLDDSTRASAGARALRLREHLPIVERLSAGGGIDAVATQLWTTAELDLVVVDSLVALLPGDACYDEELATHDAAAEGTGARPRRRHIGHGAAARAF